MGYDAPGKSRLVLRAFVLHWDAVELDARIGQVAAAGAHVVGAEHSDGQQALRLVKELKPDVLAVWLDRRPGDGRVTAAAIRSYGWASELAVLFVDEPAQPLPKAGRAKLEEVLPDAIVATPTTLAAWLARIEAAQRSRRRIPQAAATGSRAIRS
jgi:chemotaxis response regulator CheB